MIRFTRHVKANFIRVVMKYARLLFGLLNSVDRKKKPGVVKLSVIRASEFFIDDFGGMNSDFRRKGVRAIGWPASNLDTGQAKRLVRVGANDARSVMLAYARSPEEVELK